MKAIEEVKQFVIDFTEWEYKVKRSGLDTTTSKEQHFKDARYFLEHFYSHQWIPIVSGGVTTKPEGVEPEILKKNFERVQKRKLYIIRQYENAKFGKGIHADNNVLFSCILGPNTTLDDIEMYSKNLCVAVVEGSLKIIAVRSETNETHTDGKIKWEVPKRSSAVDEGYTIVDEGDLIATLRIEAPEWKESLTDYNID